MCKVRNGSYQMEIDPMSKSNEQTNVTVVSASKFVPTKLEVPTNLNVSQTIRWLSAAGLSRGHIVKYFETYLGRTIRYQHVRNVLITPVKKV